MNLVNLYENLEIKERFMSFIENFKLSDGFKPYCLTQISRNFLKKNIVLNVNLSHVAEYDPQLYLEIIGFPNELVSFFDFIVNTTFIKNNIFGKIQKQNKIKVSLWIQKLNLPGNKEEISPKLFNKLILIQGRIIKITKNLSELSSILFKCQICDFETYSIGEIGNIQEPIYCYNCKNFNSFEIIYYRCFFNKIRFLKIQAISSSDTGCINGKNFLLISRNHFPIHFKVGDWVKTTSILRAKPFYDKVKKSDSIFFNLYLDSLHIIKISRNFSCNKIRNEIDNKRFPLKPKAIETMLHSIFQNLNFFNMFQDSFFTGEIGTDTFKKTFAMVYLTCRKVRKFSQNNLAIPINLLLRDTCHETYSINLKNIYGNLKRSIFIDGKIDSDKEINFFFDFQNELSENRLIKGKLLSNNFKVCCIESLHHFNNENFLVLKEILTKKKISVTKPGINWLLQTHSSVVASMKESEQMNHLENQSLIFEKNRESVVNLFDLTYVLTNQKMDFFEKYMLKYHTHMICRRNTKIKSELSKLKIFGIKPIGIFYFLDFKKAKSNIITPFFSLFEIVKMGNLTKILSKLISNENIDFFKNYFEKIKSIAFGISELRMSKFIALEDVRMAFILIAESLKSSSLLKNLNKNF